MDPHNADNNENFNTTHTHDTADAPASGVNRLPISEIGGSLPPPVSENQAAEPARASIEAGKAPLKDSGGNVFNPDLHETGKDGKPVYRQSKKNPKVNGLFKKKRGNAKTGKAATFSQVAAPPDPQPQTDNGQPAPVVQPVDPHALAATAIVDTFFGLGQMVFGEEWRPISGEVGGIRIDERAQGIEHWTNYCRTKDIRDIPPGIAVSIWSLTVVSSRMVAPQTQSRMGKIWGKVKRAGGKLGGFVSSMRKRKPAKQPDPQVETDEAAA